MIFLETPRLPAASLLSALCAAEVTTLFGVFSAATPSLSSQLKPKSPHHTPARQRQERSDRKGLLDKTEAS